MILMGDEQLIKGKVRLDVLNIMVQKGNQQMSDCARFLDPIQRRNHNRPLPLRRYCNPLGNNAILRACVKSVPS